MEIQVYSMIPFFVKQCLNEKVQDCVPAGFTGRLSKTGMSLLIETRQVFSFFRIMSFFKLGRYDFFLDHDFIRTFVASHGTAYKSKGKDFRSF